MERAGQLGGIHALQTVLLVTTFHVITSKIGCTQGVQEICYTFEIAEAVLEINFFE